MKLIAHLLLLFVSTISAQYYVSPSGSDSNSGTIDSPFKTLNNARSMATANNVSTVYLRGGYYDYTQTATTFAAVHLCRKTRLHPLERFWYCLFSQVVHSLQWRVSNTYRWFTSTSHFMDSLQRKHFSSKFNRSWNNIFWKFNYAWKFKVGTFFQ